MKMLSRKADGKLQCIACNWRCVIPEGHAGVCGVRVNDKGKLKLTVYGRPCAVNIDPIEKKPLFHFLPGTKSFSIGTFGCNFACEFCQNWDISQAPHEAKEKDPARWRKFFDEIVKKCEEWPPKRVVDKAVRSGCASIAFTYNEPTIFTEYALDIMKLAKKKGLRGVYVTNGYESKECWDAIKGSIDAVNIDLKAFTERFYRETCHVPSLEPVKESIKYARKLGIWVEVTTLFIPDMNDSEKEMKEIAEFLAGIDKEMPWHVTAFYPAYKLMDKEPTPPETLIKAREIGLAAGLKHVYCGNVSASYSEYETTYCPKCAKPLIKRVYFSMEKDDIKEGRCRFCKAPVKGVWR